MLKRSGRVVRIVTDSSLASWKGKGTLRTFIPNLSAGHAQLTTRAGLFAERVARSLTKRREEGVHIYMLLGFPDFRVPTTRWGQINYLPAAHEGAEAQVDHVNV